MSVIDGLYNAEISAGSLMLPESRRVARFMLANPDPDDWIDALHRENILQKRSPTTARRQARLIRKRLDTLDEPAWRMIADGEQELATQALLAAAIKHSRLLGDFMRDVVAGRIRRLEPDLDPGDWDAFLVECGRRDAKVASWSDSTRRKLLQVVLRMLAEARYIASTRHPQLTPPLLHPDLVRYLRKRSETSVLAAMELAA